MNLRHLGCALLAFVSACVEAEQDTLAPSVVALTMPERYGDLRRPAVLFDHARHTRAVTSGCDECHPRQGERLAFSFMRAADPIDPDEVMDLYHDECMGCHEERAGQDTGPVTCGECHVEHGKLTSGRAAMRFDYSLHGRHVLAENGACGTCHHVYVEDTGALEYVKGQESACRDCHGATGEGRTPSLRDAAHRNCVNCHLERSEARRASGPDRCVGCHDRDAQLAIARLEHPPRINRGQPDRTWVSGVPAGSRPVPFDHERHEVVTANCSTCHHETLAKCSECHTLSGHEDGDGVTLEAAHHDPYSERSCVGCHARTAAVADCAGCHAVMEAGPSDRSCEVCHRGPVATTRGPVGPAEPIADVELAPLSRYTSIELPPEVVIDAIAQDYEPSVLPHGAIVDALDDAVRRSRLAMHFHRTTTTLCEGCHHHGSPDAKPPHQPPCGSCHPAAGGKLTKQPSLKAAYHQQCIGCHERMNLEARGCTDCHEEATKEVSP
jgi:hypothetical protein